MSTIYLRANDPGMPPPAEFLSAESWIDALPDDAELTLFDEDHTPLGVMTVLQYVITRSFARALTRYQELFG